MDVQLLINNNDVAATNGATFARMSPVSGRLVSRVAAASPADATQAADAAAAALPGWAALGPSARRGLLLKAADRIQEKMTEFVETMVAETGATRAWASFNVGLAASMMREAAALTTQVTGETIPSDRPGCVAMSVRRPAGVVLGIAPWNAPIILGVRAIATPLACGNTVILKASEMCPGTHRLIGVAMREAGLPPGTVNIVTNAPDEAPAVVEALINHKAVRRVNFTGSTKVGRVIAHLCAEVLKPALLELGGKAPLIVLDDADLDEAVAAAAFGAYMNSGQICMSTERIVVLDDVADEFVARLGAKVATLEAGDPDKGGFPLGSIIDPGAAVAITELIADALEKGAVLHGAKPDGRTLMSAVLLDRVTPAMAVYGLESFGPVTTVVRVRNEEEAIAVANDTDYGLTSSIFTGDAARGLRIAAQIDAGMCHINGPTVHDEAHMPFGGTKSSGYGRFGGRAGLEEFTELHWITIDTKRGHFPI